jgi:hypothetical protein
VVVFPDLRFGGVGVAFLERLLHEPEFHAGGVGQFAPHAHKRAVLIEDVAGDIGSEIHEHLVPQREVGLLVFSERHCRPQHVSKAVFVPPVLHIGSGFHFTDPALFDAEPILPFQAERSSRVENLLPRALFGKSERSRVVSVGVGFHIRPARAETQVRIQRVVDAGPDQELLPVAPGIGPPVLNFQMQSPRAACDRVVAHVVEPKKRVVIKDIFGSDCTRREARDDGGDAEKVLHVEQMVETYQRRKERIPE